MKPSPVCRATPSACAIKCADKLREAIERALLRFPHMMRAAEPTETAFRYRRNVQPAVVLPFDSVSTPYTIGSKDTNGCRFPRRLHGFGPSIWSIGTLSRMDADSGSYRWHCFPVPENCGFPVENDGSVRGMDAAGLPRKRKRLRAAGGRIFAGWHLETPEAVHAPVQWGADGSEVVTEVT